MSDTYENYATNFELKEEEHWEDSLVPLIRDAGISRDHSAQARAVHVATNDHTIATLKPYVDRQVEEIAAHMDNNFQAVTIPKACFSGSSLSEKRY